MSQKLYKASCMALWGPQYQSEAARQLDVHLHTVTRWDSGETAIPQSTWNKLGGRLKIESRYIYEQATSSRAAMPSQSPSRNCATRPWR